MKNNIKLPKYNNVDIEKARILQENTKKSGIYMFKNLINGKRYIEPAQDIRVKFYQYFNIKSLERHNYMYICRALLKHGYSNFRLEILEYCDPDKCRFAFLKNRKRGLLF
jgi:group I intron endonuclease